MTLGLFSVSTGRDVDEDAGCPGEDEGVDEEDVVFTHMVVEDQEIVPPGLDEPGLADMEMEGNVAEEELIEAFKVFDHMNSNNIGQNFPVTVPVDTEEETEYIVQGILRCCQDGLLDAA